MLTLLGLVWEALQSQPGASLPPPSKVVADTWELIVNPLYDNGGNDKGLFWHLFASLKRVATGYLLAACCGIALGVLIGSSKWAMRALDPLFQVLRTILPLAWLPLSLAAFRDGQPSAIFVIFITAIWPIIITAVGVRNIPQDYRNVARCVATQWRRVLHQDHVAGRGAVHLHRAANRRTLLARHRRRGNADRRRRHRLLHLGCVEQLAHQRHHPGAGLASGSSVSCWTG